ncbi:MAG: hypothetical protein IPP29_06735 [Bacteroidetes bacterium]|nr:hypothetical protein [Bacteroidota bacterium]
MTTQNVANLAPNTYTVTVTDANGCTTTLSQAITQPNALALTMGTVTNVNAMATTMERIKLQAANLRCGALNVALNIKDARISNHQPAIGHNKCKLQWQQQWSNRSNHTKYNQPCAQYVYCNCYRC